jgi:hypothetical protein
MNFWKRGVPSMRDPPLDVILRSPGKDRCQFNEKLLKLLVQFIVGICLIIQFDI